MTEENKTEKEIQKKEEPKKFDITEKLSNMNKDNKKIIKEQKVEELVKSQNIGDIIKNMTEENKNEKQVVLKEEPKKIDINEKLKNMNTEKNNSLNEKKSVPQNPKGGDFMKKLSQMNEIFKAKGIALPGQSGGRANDTDNGIIRGNENNDEGNIFDDSGKAKPKYDPSDALEKALDSIVVVQKKKMKKKKINFKG